MSHNPTNDSYLALVIVASDRASRRVYEDQTGPVALSWLKEQGYHVDDVLVLPDDPEMLLSALEDHHGSREIPGVDLIIVCGGTGLGPRDFTPQIVARYADYEIPGFGEIMRFESQKITPKAILSRCGAWVIGTQLILAIPGSPKATYEHLSICQNLIPKALRALRNQCQHPEPKGMPNVQPPPPL